MAAINDNAGVFVGATLDAFNALEALVLRDGDVAGTQAAMLKALRDAAHTKNSASGSGQTFTHRAQ